MIDALWTRFYGWILAAAGILAALGAVFYKGKAAGKAVEQKKEAERDLVEVQRHAETIRETSDVQAEVTRLPDATVQQRLRDHWSRD